MVPPNKLAAVRVKDGRVPFAPETVVRAPVPMETIPFQLKFPTPATTAFAAFKLTALAAPGVIVRVALRLRSRTAVRVILPLLVRLRSIVRSLKPVMLIAPKVDCGTRLVVVAVKDGRTPFEPESKVRLPVPTERLPSKLRLPVPAVELLAAFKLSAPAAPVVSVAGPASVRSRRAVAVMLPPVVILLLMVMSPVAATVAVRIIFPRPPLLIMPLTTILFEEVTVSAKALFHDTGSRKVISPSPPVPAALVMVTLAEPSAVSSVVTFRFEEALAVLF